jgi:peptidoglycan/LPS O-acetylase OafA/YrhL
MLTDVQYLPRVGMSVITNGALAVDTFFFLSGLLTAYVACCDRKKGKQLVLWKYYVYRYLRYIF